MYIKTGENNYSSLPTLTEHCRSFFPRFFQEPGPSIQDSGPGAQVPRIQASERGTQGQEPRVFLVPNGIGIQSHVQSHGIQSHIICHVQSHLTVPMGAPCVGPWPQESGTITRIQALGPRAQDSGFAMKKYNKSTKIRSLVGSSWGPLGASWGPLGASWAQLGTYVSKSGPRDGSQTPLQATLVQPPRPLCLPPREHF